MREICQSGSMSGNRKQNYAKPDCGDEAKAESLAHRETTVTAPVLDSTRHSTSLRFPFAYRTNKRRKVAITPVCNSYGCNSYGSFLEKG
jgi:hypothetical protein